MSTAGANSAQTQLAFAFAELSFDRIALCSVLLLLLSIIGVTLFFGWPAKLRAAKTNPAFLAVVQVIAIAVDLVGQNDGGEISEPLFVRFHRILQRGRLVEAVLPSRFDPGVAINQTGGDFSAEFHVSAGFAADDRTNMRLFDAHNAIRYGMRLVLHHVTLLPV